MQNLKRRIIGVVILLVMICAVMVIPQIKAEEVTSAEETVTELTCEELVDKYGLFIEATGNPDEFRLIKDPTIECEDGKIYSDVSVNVFSINGTLVSNGVTLTKNNDEYVFKAGFLGPIDGNTYYVSVIVVNAANPDEKIEVKYFEEREAAGTGTVGKYNSNYDGLCYTYRETAKAQNGVSFFETALPYCYQETVVVNYTETELQKKIDSIVSLWSAYQSQNNSGTADFNALFNEIKTKAHIKSATNVVLDPLNTTITLKCAYDRVRTGVDAPKTYTTDYGDTISSLEYYLNKDYYYSTATTIDGEVKYVYNFAPGNTVTDTQQACKRTCEEAVKVEYGPPVASKAGLCFEYKVKVSSYVKCTAEVIAQPPKQFSNYCNPAPICYSVGGTLRSLEQAGPKEQFDQCINSCDGGKYSEKCSIKCYNEVYGKSNKKLAINYEDALLAKTAMATESSLYSQAQCLKDNTNYFGCYVYNGDEIQWLSNLNYAVEKVNGKEEVVFKQVTWNQRYALGRWYLDRVYKQKDGTYLDQWNKNANYVRSNGGYDITAIYDWCTASTGNDLSCLRYVADQQGIYRSNKNNSLCTDNCHWRYKGDAEDKANKTTGLCKRTPNSVDGNDYLNPGTIEQDAKANQAAYEDAVRSCIGTASCSEKTAEFTISLTYDTTTNEVKKQNTITFPYDTKKDALAANKANEIKDRSRTSILAYDGCYDKNKNIQNHYMTEWSFPGTYIHNKTGEISFQRPAVTDGWYYDDKKFCMPLDADSVNAKWWEWYKLGNMNGCYDTKDVEKELAGKAGTSNGYNITAKTYNTDDTGKPDAKKGFGYFGWGFDIKCFYALRNEMCNVNKDGCCAPATKESNGVSNYTFRSVATNNLFPNAKAENVIDPDKRDIGFNWTSKALSMKNDDYVVDPVKLIEHIENGAAGLYSNDSTNLDYQFYLTPATLAKIKSYNNNNDYASWNGTVDLVNGIKVYQSNLFRNVGSHTKVLSDIPSSIIELGLPGVNNECYGAGTGATQCSIGKKK